MSEALTLIIFVATYAVIAAFWLLGGVFNGALPAPRSPGSHGRPTPRTPLGGSLALGHERDLAPRHLVDLPLLVLREVVEAEDAVEGAAIRWSSVLPGHGLGAHGRAP